MQYTAHIDRPLGTSHPRHPEMIYPVNYGFIPGLLAGDGAEQDVYVLGVDVPCEAFTGELIAIIHRRDDVEDKWVLAPAGMRFTAEEIMTAVHFQEQWFDSYCVLNEAPLTYLVADAAHEEAAISLRLDCLRAVNGWTVDAAFPAEFVAETRAFLQAADQTTWLVFDGDLPVACATLCYVRYIPTPGHPTGKRAHLMNVYVAESHRRRGIARRLIQLLHREACQRGVTEITLDATDAGRKVYETMGYRASDEAMYFDVK